MTTITLESIQARQTELAAMIAAFAASGERTINVPATTIEPRPGEHYAGVVLHDDGTPSHHLVLMAARPGERLAWQDAKGWAAEVGGALPTRREQSLIYAHCRAHVEHEWHWSSETYEGDASYAWCCGFLDGTQYLLRKSFEACAVAIRRFAA